MDKKFCRLIVNWGAVCSYKRIIPEERFMGSFIYRMTVFIAFSILQELREIFVCLEGQAFFVFRKYVRKFLSSSDILNRPGNLVKTEGF